MGQIRNRKPIDMMDYEFQTWKVVAISDKKGKNNNQYWTCECQICHKTKDFCGSEIRLGRTGECKHKVDKSNPFYQADGILSNKIINEIGNRYGHLLVESFAYTKNSTAYWNCRCDCGHTTIARGNALRQGQIHSCGCLNSWKEEEIVALLDKEQIIYKREYIFEDLYDIRPLRFDFAIFNRNNELLGLIEYQGSQHYEDNPKFTNNGKLQKHDQMKREYCVNHNIPLLELNKGSMLYTTIMEWYMNINSLKSPNK